MKRTNTKNLAEEHYFNENDSTTLEEIESLANKLLDETWLIETYESKPKRLVLLRERGWTFEFNNRKRAVGLSNYRKKTIYVSKYALEDNLDKAFRFENTLRHEIAHALDNALGMRSNHGTMWKKIAKQVLCTGDRCTKGELARNKPSKYTLICDTCGIERPSHKKKRRKSACGICCDKYNGGRYSEKYVFRQVQNY